MDIAPAFLDVVFSKTDKGVREISDRAHGLPARLRQVLILVDGSKSVARLAAAVPGLPVLPALQDLAAQGYIGDGQQALPVGATVADAPRADTPPAASVVDPMLFTEIKDIMASSAREFLGVMAQPLLADIERASDPARLKSVIARWSVALRESRRGGEHAEQYLQAVKTLAGF
ncbi:hypothetical protein [Chitinolyticbacter meiyuanensis]|uniref:hypothetical protein n=1 Tax=Chitinolyticbacter meiyuanensis TaxID=682798 RepID=UPI0011E5BCBE|nr:hypothetical protein [Chitinolyticbacter meiyuanensis]